LTSFRVPGWPGISLDLARMGMMNAFVVQSVGRWQVDVKVQRPSKRACQRRRKTALGVKNKGRRTVGSQRVRRRWEGVAYVSVEA